MSDDYDERPLPKIRSAAPLDGRRVAIEWGDGEKGIIDVMPALLARRLFIRLRTDDELFRSMRVNEDGNAVEWPDGAELSAIWIERLSGGLDNSDFRKAMEELDVNLDGMAAELGIARRLVADYRKDKPIPKTVALAVKYLVEHQRKAG